MINLEICQFTTRDLKEKIWIRSNTAGSTTITNNNNNNKISSNIVLKEKPLKQNLFEEIKDTCFKIYAFCRCTLIMIFIIA
jgi:hypothetical protein